jgi:hypothetical protein
MYATCGRCSRFRILWDDNHLSFFRQQVLGGRASARKLQGLKAQFIRRCSSDLKVGPPEDQLPVNPCRAVGN